MTFQRVKNFSAELYSASSKDAIFMGAAALGFYLTLAIFPALIFLLSLLPYLPIENLQQAIMEFLHQALPTEAANMLSDTVTSITQEENRGLLSIGAIATLWAASSGMYAIMQELNVVYKVEEGRSFLKARAVALGLTVFFGFLLVAAFTLVVMGGHLQELLASVLGWSEPLLIFFAVLRWVIVVAAILLGFSAVYFWGPNVKHKYAFITPGNIFGTVVLVLASALFKLYITNFGNYDATYGSLGAMIILMFWLYVSGLVLLFGAEVNTLAKIDRAEAVTKPREEKQQTSTKPSYA